MALVTYQLSKYELMGERLGEWSPLLNEAMKRELGDRSRCVRLI